MPETKIYDGHIKMTGVDTSSDPAELGTKFAATAVNRAFRGGNNKTRPPFHSRTLSFDTDENKQIFERGSISGVFGYRKWFRYSQPHLIVAVHDRLLKGRMFGDHIAFSLLYKGIDPQYLHSWFVQGQDRLYWQNGVQRPVGWDGAHDAYLIEAGDDKMPVFTNMVYAHGRLIGFTEDNYAIISDHVYGNGLKDTTGLEKWIEYQAFNDLGAIAPPGDFGDVVGAIVIPRMETRNGQGDVLVLQEDGAYLLDITGPRDGWMFGDIQKPTLHGRGGASSYGIVAANNDIWYQSSDGDISSFKFERGEKEKAWGDTSLSREVEKFLQYTDRSHLRFVSGTKAHNRLLFTCAISVEKNTEYSGAHRFGMGIVALDFDKGSTVNPKPGFSWDGMWTGPNVIQFAALYVDKARRNLAVSHDDDGINRIYELMATGSDDVIDGTNKKIVSFYDTPYLFEQQEATIPPTIKSLIGVNVLYADVQDSASISLEYRPDYYEDWIPVEGTIEVGCSNIPPMIAASPLLDRGNFSGEHYTQQVDEAQCRQASFKLASRGMQFQLRVRLTGSVTIKMTQAEANIFIEETQSSCGNVDAGRECDMITLVGTDLFEYSLIP